MTRLRGIIAREQAIAEHLDCAAEAAEPEAEL